VQVDISQQLYLVDTVGAVAVKSTLMGRFAPLYGDLAGVLPRPAKPTARLCVLEARWPGNDKAGHRADTVPICNAVIGAGGFCEPVFYSDEHLELLREYLTACDGVIVRIAPGVYPGVTHQALHALLREMAAAGKTILPHPDVEDVMRSKRALCKVGALQCGLPDSLVYTSREQMWQGFRRTAAFQPRVVKGDYGVGGEGVWLVRLKSGEYCSTLGQRELGGDELLVLQEMNDGHEEEHTVAQFVEFCAAGRSVVSGVWASAGIGRYLLEHKRPEEVLQGGLLLDQPFLPHAATHGVVRCVMRGDVCVELVRPHWISQDAIETFLRGRTGFRTLWKKPYRRAALDCMLGAAAAHARRRGGVHPAGADPRAVRVAGGAVGGGLCGADGGRGPARPPAAALLDGGPGEVRIP
jgi:hypothetical protein